VGYPKGEEDGRRPPALWADHPKNVCKAVSGVARPQSIEWSGMAGPGETLRSPWIPLAIRSCSDATPAPSSPNKCKQNLYITYKRERIGSPYRQPLIRKKELKINATRHKQRPRQRQRRRTIGPNLSETGRDSNSVLGWRGCEDPKHRVSGPGRAHSYSTPGGRPSLAWPEININCILLILF
jgi:hypothetical protein